MATKAPQQERDPNANNFRYGWPNGLSMLVGGGTQRCATNIDSKVPKSIVMKTAMTCHFEETRALMAAAQGGTPTRVGCRSAAYRELTINALRHSAQLSDMDVENTVNLWATNALLLGLDAVEMDLR